MRTFHRIIPLAPIVMALALMAPPESFANPLPPADKESERWIQGEYAHNSVQFGGNPDFLVAPGVLADRSHRTVTVAATATGIDPKMPVEFLLVNPHGKAYESVLVTPVLPSQLARALEFIGMRPGHPVNHEQFHFSPKGERATITIRWAEAPPESNPATPGSLPAEQLLYNLRAKQPIPRHGFRFVGSTWTTSPDDGQEPICMADRYGEIVALFNSRWTLFDVPYDAAQSASYGAFAASPEQSLQKGQQVYVEFRPEYADGRTRIVDLTLQIGVEGSREWASDADVTMALKRRAASQIEVQPATSPSADGFSFLSQKLPNKEPIEASDTISVATGGLEQILAALEGLVQAGQEPFLTIQFSDRLPVKIVAEICLLIQPIVAKDIVRVEGTPGHLYYQAFLPAERWRDPSQRNRGMQPIELHVRQIGGNAGAVGEWIRYTAVRQPVGGTEFQPITTAFASEEELRQQLAAGRPWDTKGVFLYVNEQTVYGDLARLYRLVDDDFPNAYVFITAPRSDGGAD